MIPVERIVMLSTPFFDPLGYFAVRIAGTGKLPDIPRRITVTPTLDGGVVADDMGASPGDREWQLTVVLGPDALQPGALERLRYLQENYTELHLSTAYGFFRVALLNLTLSGDRAEWVVHVLEQLAT